MTRTAKTFFIPKRDTQSTLPDQALPQDPRLEAGFLDYDQGSLNPAHRGHPHKIQRHLAHLIRRQPKALRLHIQRILLHLEQKDSDMLGALWDLFLVLGDAGQPLRRRMLNLAKPLLPADSYRLLDQHIERPADVDAFWQSDLGGSAVLHQGISGTTRLVFKTSGRQAQTEDPLDEAEAQLACGQSELAQKTLEQALLTDSSHLDIHLALLEIYRHSRDLSRVKQIRARLNGRENPAENEWRRLQQMLEEEIEKQ